MAFELDARLRNDTHLIARNQDALLLLMNDCRYPWLIVVPTLEGASEWFNLDVEQQARLHLDSVRLGRCVQQAFDCEKINIAALGNVVRQMHIHVVGRNGSDPAWPGPVWGHSAAIPYSDTQLKERKLQLFAQSDLPFSPL